VERMSEGMAFLFYQNKKERIFMCQKHICFLLLLNKRERFGKIELEKKILV
jgi:hypothetical protein